MGINKHWVGWLGSWLVGWLGSWLVGWLGSWLVGWVLLSTLVIACGSIRPVIKIGLIGPFEGLHRRSGYEALTAMRQAIADTAPNAVDLLPVALDDSSDPEQARRALQKLLQDSQVRAIVGPLRPETVASVTGMIETSRILWAPPFEISRWQGLSTHQTIDQWAFQLIHAIGEAARQLGCERLVLAGWTPGWPQASPLLWEKEIGMPILISEVVEKVQTKDAVLWLGAPEAAANYLAALRARYPTLPFWFGPEGGSPILHERALIQGPTYWSIWTDETYAQWVQTHQIATPTAYLTYRATQYAIAVIIGQSLPQPPKWTVQHFIISPNGVSRPFLPYTPLCLKTGV